MFDHDYRMTLRKKCIKRLEELLDIVEMQSGGRLVKYEEDLLALPEKQAEYEDILNISRV